jgi:hypothetical protein
MKKKAYQQSIEKQWIKNLIVVLHQGGGGRDHAHLESV